MIYNLQSTEHSKSINAVLMTTIQTHMNLMFSRALIFFASQQDDQSEKNFQMNRSHVHRITLADSPSQLSA